jgi:glucose 1-dehydrogenase
MGRLTNKVVVITGSSRGFGLAMAAEFQHAGARVVLSSRDGERLKQAVASLPDPTGAFRIPCDVRDLVQVRGLAQAAVKKFNRIDIWVNNAGLAAPWGKLLQIDPAAWRASFDTNIIGTYNGCRAALEIMAPAKRGQILNILGFGADRPAPNQSPYGTSKAAIAMLTRTLALEYGGTGITVNAVQPGMIWTEMLTRAQGVEDPNLRTRMEWAMRVFGNPAEVPARFVVHVAVQDGANGKIFRVITPRVFLPRMIREMLGAGKSNPRPWESRGR